MGTTIGEICRKVGIAEATFDRWKKIHAGMGVADSCATRSTTRADLSDFADLSHLAAKRPREPELARSGR